MRSINKAILIASTAFCLSLSVFSQDISLKISNVTVKEAMEQLKRTSGYSFVFSSLDVDTQKRISVSIKDATIEEVINQILMGQKVLITKFKVKKLLYERHLQLKL